jgi:hypothetical protein
MILFNGGNVPVVRERKPPADNVPIADPIPVGNTNTAFLAKSGARFYALDTTIPHRPLWQKALVSDSVEANLTFMKIDDIAAMG